MTPRQYSIIVLRGFALYSGITTFSWIPWIYADVQGLLSRYGEQSEGMFILFFVIAIAVPLLTASTVWDRAPQLSDRILTFDSDMIDVDVEEESVVDEDPSTSPDVTKRLTQEEILGLVVVCLGLWAIVMGSSNLVYTVIEWISYFVKYNRAHSIEVGAYASTARIVFGLWLVMKSRGIVRGIKMLRGNSEITAKV